MHMFWAVRRLTPSQMKLENARIKAGEIPLRFNCSLRDESANNVCISSQWGQTTNRARTVTIPFLVNHEPLLKGEELIMGIPEPAKKEGKKGFRQHYQEDEANGDVSPREVAATHDTQSWPPDAQSRPPDMHDELHGQT